MNFIHFIHYSLYVTLRSYVTIRTLHFIHCTSYVTIRTFSAYNDSAYLPSDESIAEAAYRETIIAVTSSRTYVQPSLISCILPLTAGQAALGPVLEEREEEREEEAEEGAEEGMQIPSV